MFFLPCASLHIYQQRISSAVLSECLTPCAGDPLLQTLLAPQGSLPRTPCMVLGPLTSAWSGSRSACKVHWHRITNSRWRKTPPESRDTVRLPFKVMGRNWWVGCTFCTLSVGAWSLGKHTVLSQRGFYNPPNTMQTHSKTESKWTSSPRGSVLHSDTSWCAEQAASVRRISNVTAKPFQFKKPKVTLWLICFSTRYLQKGECPVFLLRASTMIRETVAFGVLIQTKNLRERSFLQAVNNTTVTSLYKVKQTAVWERGG